MNTVKSLNRFHLDIAIEFHGEAGYAEETVSFPIYADVNLFGERDRVLSIWQQMNPEKELVDYTVTNHRQYNEWLATQG